MTEYADATFMVDLILGTDNRAFNRDLEYGHYEALYADTKHLAEIVRRTREQTRHIAQSLRHWGQRHQELRHPLKRKYSAYEGMLCRQDLKQHLILYKHALREYHNTRKLCDQSIEKQVKFLSQKPRKSRTA